MIDFEQLKERKNKSPFFDVYNGIFVTKISEGYCEAEVELTEHSLNPAGLAHGGLIYTLCDIVSGVAATTLGKAVLTLSSSMDFLRPGVSGKMKAVGTCVKVGKTVGVYDANVYDEQGRHIARGSFHYYFTDTDISALFEGIEP